VSRYFHLQLACGAVALLHLLGEWIYLGGPPRGPGLGLLIALVAAGLLGGCWLQPKMKELHTTKYLSVSAVTRETADRSFRAWRWPVTGDEPGDACRPGDLSLAHS